MIPSRLRPLEPQILAEYSSGDTYDTLAYRYRTSKAAIGEMVTRAGIQRKPINTKGNPRKHVRKLGDTR